MSPTISALFICMGVFSINLIAVYCQLHPHKAEIVREAKAVSDSIEYEGEKSVTQSMLDVMLMDLTAGTTPKVCGPFMSCGFQRYKYQEPWNHDPEDFITYCPQCVGGYECRFFSTNMRMEYNVFTCQKVKQTTSGVTPEMTHTPRIEDRIGDMADVHEL